MLELPQIEVGYQVFTEDGGEEFGAVREVAPEGRPSIIVYVENSGAFDVPLTAVKAVHDEKVVLEATQLPGPMREAIAHAHEREEF